MGIELIINACIAFTGIYIISKLLEMKRSLLWQIAAGLLGGGLGYLLMKQSVVIDNETIIDLRYIPMLLFSFYGLPIPLFISTVLIGSLRFLLGMAEVSLVTFLGTLLLGWTLYKIQEKLAFNQRSLLFQLISLNGWTLAFITLLLILHMGFTSQLGVVVGAYWVMGSLVGLAVSLLTLDVKKTEELKKQFEKKSMTDFLTGIGNVRYWNQVLQRVHLQHKKRPFPLAILTLDIDHFKKVNDTYGHYQGDQVLKEFVSRVKKTCAPADVFARMGGEEFGLLISKESKDEILKRAEAIRKTIEQDPFKLDQVNLHLTTSIGIHYISETAANLNLQEAQLFADEALYKAKAAGRNRVVLVEEAVSSV